MTKKKKRVSSHTLLGGGGGNGGKGVTTLTLLEDATENEWQCMHLLQQKINKKG